MNESNTPKTVPPPAQNLVILSGDLLAVEVHRLIDGIANFQTYGRYEQLRSALNTYTEARFEGILNHTEPSETFREYIKGGRDGDPQRMQINPLPTCESCKHKDKCSGLPAADRDCYQPPTQRNS